MTHQQCHLDPPTDKTLTCVKSLNLDVCSGPVPRKNQVKMISSCPLPQPSTDTHPGSGSGPQNRDKAYSQVQVSTAAEVGVRRECLVPPEPEYSLPFDTVTANVLKAGGTPGPTESVTDPLYDSIDETLIRNIFLSDDQSGCRKVEHIYDEPEGCAAPTLQKEHASVYDDPEEMRGDAWGIMGTAADPKNQDPLFNLESDYAVPKRLQRKLADIHTTNKEERVQEEESQHEHAEDSQGSPYSNVMANAKCSSVSKTND